MNQSPYRRGADDGFLLGIYFTAMFFASIYSSVLPILSLAALLLMAGVPVAAWILMRRYQRAEQWEASFPMLWMQGVMMFMCGMLIAGAALLVYMKWIEPDFISSQLQALAALAGSEPGSFVDVAADTAARMLEARFIPTPTDIVVELLLLAVVSGSFLSMFFAGLMVAIRPKRHL